MDLRSWWQQRKQRRIQRYVTQHAAVALDVFRQFPDLANTTMTRILEAAGTAPQRDTMQYPVLSSFGYGGSSVLLRTLPKTVPFAIRRFSEYPPARRAIQAIVQPIVDMPWSIVPRSPIGTEEHVKTKITRDQQQRIVALTDMLNSPNNEQSGREVFEMILEDLVVLGGGCLEAQPNTSDERPLFLFPVDTQSIRVNMQWQPGSKSFRYSQGKGYVFGALGVTDDVKLRDDELLYMKLNNRTHTPFGFGYLETAFDVINAFVGAFSYAERRASNNTPNFGIFLGENVTIDQVRRWQHYWENEIEGYGKVPILGGGRQPQVFNMTGTGEDQLWLRWQEFLIRVVAMSFGLSPMKLGLMGDVNRSTAQESTANDWATVAPVANTLENAITSWILWKRLGWKDLEFQWQVRTTDEMRQAQVLMEQYRMNGITIDEIRKFYGRPPLEDGMGDMTKTSYEMAVKAAAMGAVGVGGPENPMGDNNISGSAAIITPFDDDPDAVDAQTKAWIRDLIRCEAEDRIAT